MLTIDEYKKMKSEGKIVWDTSSFENTRVGVNNLAQTINGQYDGSAALISQSGFDELQGKKDALRRQVDFMQLYANSLKDTDSTRYGALNEHISGLRNTLDQADSYFDQGYNEASKVHKSAVEANELKKEVDRLNAGKEADDLLRSDGNEKGTSSGRIALDGSLSPDFAKNDLQKLIEDAAIQNHRLEEIGKKYEMSASEVIEARKNYQASKHLQTVLKLTENKSAAELAELVVNDSKGAIPGVQQNWLSDDDRNGIYAQIMESATDSELSEIRKSLPSGAAFNTLRSSIDQRLKKDGYEIVEQLRTSGSDDKYSYKYKDMSFDELVGVITNPDRIGRDVSNSIRNLYGDHLEKTTAETRKYAFELFANKYGVSADEAKKAYERETGESNDHYYDSYALTENERKYVFSRILETGSAGELSKLRESLPNAEIYNDLRKGIDRLEKHRENELRNDILSIYAEAMPVGASLASVPMNMIGSISDLPTVVGAQIDKFNGGDGWYDPTGTANYQANVIRNKVLEKIGSDNALGSLAYSTLMSMSDMGLAALANTIPVAGQFLPGAMFFSSAGVNAANEVIENGGDINQATMTLIAHGAAELVFEEISLDKLLKVKNAKNLRTLFKNILKQSVVEGSEEVATTFANTLTDAWINGGNSELNRNIKAYEEQGLSREEAEKSAWTDWAGGVLNDFIGGAVSGAAMGGTVGSGGYLMNKRKTGLSNLKVTQGEMTDLLSTDEKGNATADARQTALDITKKQGVDAVLEAAKRSLDENTQKTAKHFEELNREGKLDEKDAAALLVKVAQEQPVVDYIDAQAKEAGMESLSDFRDRSAQTEVYNSEYNLAGARVESVSSGDSASSFGKEHPNGVAARYNGKDVVVKGIESSVPEYGRGDHNVTLILDSGEAVDAADVEFSDGDYARLVNLAASYDTIGARALTSNFENARQNGLSIDDYIQRFNALYVAGTRGTDFEHAMQNPTYQSIAREMGENAARGAIEAGLADGDIGARTQSYMQKRVRVKGISFGKSKVSVERGVTEEISEDTKQVLQLVADRTGRKIVITDALNEGDRGLYSESTIYISSKQTEHAMVTAALHEAVHDMAAYSAEDFRTLQKFVANYYAAIGKDIQAELDYVGSLYGADAPNDNVRMEEVVAKTVEALASDKEALETALGVKENQNLCEKVADILRRLADRVLEFFKGSKEKGLAAHNRQAQVFLDDVKALREMAEIVGKGFDNARVNEREFGARESGVRHSFAGESAKTANLSLLQQAQQMGRDGEKSEKIRQETGWYKGYDGKWRFEIGDRGIKILDPIFMGGTLEKLIDHKRLFAAYPQLKKVRYEFESMEGSVLGRTLPDGKGIMLDRSLRRDKKALKKTLIHEIQHAVQIIEGNAGGTSILSEKSNGKTVVFENEQAAYKDLLLKIEEQYNSEAASEREWDVYDALHDIIRKIKSLDYNAADFSFQIAKSGVDLMKLTDSKSLAKAFQKWTDALYDAAFFEKSPDEWARNRYLNNAGEIEARDTAERLNLSEAQRKEKRPDIDRDDVVFADGGVSFSVDEDETKQKKLKELQNKNGRYSKDDEIIFDEESDDWLWQGFDESDSGVLNEVDPDDALGRTYGEMMEDQVAAHNEKRAGFNKLLDSNPDEAAFVAYNAAAKTTERGIRSYSGVKLDDSDYERIARRVMRGYDIKEKFNPEIVGALSADIKAFVEQVKTYKKGDFSTFINGLATKCRSYLEKSGDYKRNDAQERVKNFLNGLRHKTLLLTDYAADEVLDRYDGDIRQLRKAFAGYVHIAYEDSTKTRKYKQTVYMNEILEDFENEVGVDFFPDGERPHSLEGWGWLADMIEFQKPKLENPYHQGYAESIESAALEMAFDISTEVVSAKGEKAVTAKNMSRAMARELLKDRKKALAERDAIHKSKENQLKKQLEATKSRYKTEYLKRVSAEEAADNLKLLAASDAKSYRMQYNERQRKASYIRRLGQKLNSLTKRLDGKANRNEYIPENLKQPILDVLRMFEVVPANNRDIPGYFGAFVQIGDVSARVQELVNQYEKLKDGDHSNDKYKNLGFDIRALSYSKGVLADLKWLAELIKGKNVYEMSADELESVLEVMNELDNQLKHAVEIIIDGKKTTIMNATANGIEQTGKVKFRKDGKLLLIDALRDAKNKFLATSLDPVRFGRMLSGYKDDGVIYQLMLGLHQGDQKRVKIMQKAYSQVQSVTARYSESELKGLQRKAVEEFTMKDVRNGEDVKLSAGMLLSIYLTNLQADGHRHLVNNQYNHYTRVPDLDLMNGNRVLPDIRGNKQKAKGQDSHKIRLSDGDLERIAAYVEGNQLLKELAREIHDTFNGFLADEINKVSLENQGRMIATVKNYFPLTVDKNDPNKKFEDKFEGEGIFVDERLKSRSFTKQRTYSETAIVIDDALSVFQRHVNATAEYCGMTVPVENIKKVLSCDNGEITMKEAIEEKFGHDALHYFDKLLGDIQERKDHKDENLLTKFSGHAMGAALMVNPRSMVKNWAALPLANRYFGTKNVAAATVMGFAKGKSLVEKYNDYTPYMWFRAQGNGTVVGELSRQHGLYSKLSEKFDIMSWADQKVVNSLLYAAEQHVKQTTDLEFDSEEFKKEVARQFERVVDESQPNSMITSKPQFVRNNFMRVLSLNAFASQRMAMGNSLMDSFMEYNARRSEYSENKTEEGRKAKNEAKKKFVRTLFGVLESGLLQSALGALATVLIYHKWDDYKDDEGNVTWESILRGLGWNTAKGLPEEVLGSFVWLDKVYGAAEKFIDKDAYGVDFNVMSMSAMTDIATNIYSGNWWKVLGRTSDLLGVPLFGGTNVQRLYQSGKSYYQDIFWGQRLGFINNSGNVDLKYMDAQIAQAIEDGDGKRAEWLRALWESELEKKGKSTSIVEEKIYKTLAHGNDDIINAAIARANGDTAPYTAVIDKLTGLGLSENTAIKAVEYVATDIKHQLKNEGFRDKDAVTDELMEMGFNESAAEKLANDYLGSLEKKAPADKKKYTFSDLFNAKKNGESESFDEIFEYLVEESLDSGKYDSREDAEYELGEKIWKLSNYTKPLFKELEEATVSGDKERLDTVKRQLVNVYGSEDAYKRKYQTYRKNEEKKGG